MGQLFPSPGDLPHLGTGPRSPTLQADSLLAQKGPSERQEALRRLCIKGNAPTLLVGMEIGAATMQNTAVEKIKNRTTVKDLRLVQHCKAIILQLKLF